MTSCLMQILPTPWVVASVSLFVQAHTSLSSQAVWKRRISVLRRAGRLEEAVEELSQYLDTFYTDLEAWLELADIYSSYFL